MVDRRKPSILVADVLFFAVVLDVAFLEVEPRHKYIEERRPQQPLNGPHLIDILRILPHDQEDVDEEPKCCRHLHQPHIRPILIQEDVDAVTVLHLNQLLLNLDDLIRIVVEGRNHSRVYGVDDLLTVLCHLDPFAFQGNEG